MICMKNIHMKNEIRKILLSLKKAPYENKSLKCIINQLVDENINGND